MKRFMVSCRFSFEVYAKNTREETTKCSLKTTEVILDAYGLRLPSLLFFKVQQLQIVLRTTQTVNVLFIPKKFFLLAGLKFALSDTTSFLPDNLSGLTKIL